MSDFIKGNMEGTTMKYAIGGRLDSSNATESDQKIFELLGDNHPETIEFDLSALEYISSAGLRVFMKLMKKCPKVSATGVSPEVYDIFNVTGFTEMMTVKKALRKVSIKGCTELGHGGHGKVYRLSDDMIIKVYTDGSSLEMIDQERTYGRNAFVQGIPCAIAFDVVETEEGYGLVFEMAGAETVSSYVTKHPEQAPLYGKKMGELLKKLNTTEADPALYGSIKEIYAERLKAASSYFTDEENAALMRLLEAVPEGSGMIHGDYHPNNVMVQADGELMLIDMADISRGAPLYDIGGAYLVMVQAAAREHSLAPIIMGVSYELALQLWDGLLKEYLGTEDPARLEMCNKVFGAFCLLRMASTLGMDTSSQTAKERSAGMVALLRQAMFPNVDGFCQLFNMPL